MKLQDYINQFGIMKKFIAQKIGVHQLYISDFMAERRLPTLNQIYMIEKITQGHVTLIDWLDIEARKNQEKEEKRNKKKANNNNLV